MKDISHEACIVDIIDRDKFLIIKLEKADKKNYIDIKEKLASLKNTIDQKSYLSNVFDDLKVLLKKVDLFDNKKSKTIIEDSLLKTLDNLKQIYQNIIKHHDCFIYLNKNTENSFFQCKDLKSSFFVKLYDATCKLDLIDDVEISEADFINALISPNPQIITSKIRFTKSNYITSYYLESLKPFFHNFNHIMIEKSTVFLNKQRKILRSTDIYASLSRGKDKSQNEKIKIDTLLLKLKNEYLK